LIKLSLTGYLPRFSRLTYNGKIEPTLNVADGTTGLVRQRTAPDKWSAPRLHNSVNHNRNWNHILLSIAADKAIGLYQQYISPYKGFRCAYHAHTGHRSCSAYARAIVRKRGVFALVLAMPRQFDRCRTAYMAILESRQPSHPSARKKDKKGKWYDGCDCSGCDLGGCDLDHCHLPSRLVRECNHCDGPCDLDVGACDCSW
jgi:putative component of membrane protein insertase Oxa1/YidC/SpoIIIJ protein YidD